MAYFHLRNFCENSFVGIGLLCLLHLSSFSPPPSLSLNRIYVDQFLKTIRDRCLSSIAVRRHHVHGNTSQSALSGTCSFSRASLWSLRQEADRHWSRGSSFTSWCTRSGQREQLRARAQPSSTSTAIRTHFLILPNSSTGDQTCK